MLQKVVFLDRDGVINREGSGYVTSWSEFEFLPGSIEAVKRLTDSGFTNIIITNQSIVNRGMVARATLDAIHAKMKQIVEMGGGRIKDIFFCPHRPEEGCACRKPKPGMILNAQKNYDIDLSTAVMVGDRSKDIECAKNAGCAHTVLVKTGNGFYAERELINDGNPPDHVAKDLLEAVNWVLSKNDKKYIPPRRHH
jgi:D-glycero-D-manno-heptose 1,7-bisphosphate phosphatase